MFDWETVLFLIGTSNCYMSVFGQITIRYRRCHRMHSVSLNIQTSLLELTTCKFSGDLKSISPISTVLTIYVPSDIASSVPRL